MFGLFKKKIECVCNSCGNTAKIKEGEEAPTCCGAPMQRK